MADAIQQPNPVREENAPNRGNVAQNRPAARNNASRNYTSNNYTNTESNFEGSADLYLHSEKFQGSYRNRELSEDSTRSGGTVRKNE